MNQKRYTMGRPLPKLAVRFFCERAGVEPVRDWLKALPPEDRRIIGEELRTLQFGWPVGMPLVRKIDGSLWEIRVHLHRRAARLMFTIDHTEAVLVHGFIKKSRKTPPSDLRVARVRARQVRRAAGGK